MKFHSLKNFVGNVAHLERPELVALIQKLFHQQRLLDTVLHIIHDGVMILNPKGYLYFCNHAAQHLLGLASAKGKNAKLWHFIPELKPILSQNFSGTISCELEISYPSERLLRVYAVPFQENYRHLIALIVSDISSERSSMRQYVENERMSSVTLLAAGVAHEIGNPLNSIHLQLSLMSQQLPNSKTSLKLRESIQSCQQEVERLNHIIHSFLQAFRPVPVQWADVDIVNKLQEVLKVMQPELEGAGIDICFRNHEAEVPLILGDAQQLKQVFFNLIKNAIEATPKGCLDITTASDEDWVYLSFCDSGIGMSSEQCRRIFEPFFTSKEAGHGLGMMIVQRILRDHHAFIYIATQERNGTCLQLKFPLKNRRAKLLKAKKGLPH